MAATLSRTLRSSPYWSTLSHKTMRHVLPGFLVSSLGDGMSVVAVGWLAIELAPSGHRGLWVAIAAAAYTLPGALGVLLLGRFLRHRGPAQLVCWDAVLRACALGAIPTVYVFGLLSIELYVALLAASSVLHSWGEAGLYTLVARVLPEHDHLAGNALLSTIGSFTTVVGPALAGPLIAWSGAATVLAVDAATFVVLAVTFQSMVPTTVAAEKDTAEDEVSSASGFNVIRRNRTLLGLLTLSAGYFFLFGPVYVALPLHVSEDLHGSANLLAAFYSAFGIGAVIGGMLAGYLSRWALWPTIIGIVIGFGTVMLPLGLGASTVVALVGFALAGLLWPPYSTLSMALFQRSTPPAQLPQVLAATSSVRVLAVPLGTALGGPLVALFGTGAALRFCAMAIVVLGFTAATAMALRSAAARRSCRWLVGR